MPNTAKHGLREVANAVGGSSVATVRQARAHEGIARALNRLADEAHTANLIAYAAGNATSGVSSDAANRALVEAFHALILPTLTPTPTTETPQEATN